MTHTNHASYSIASLPTRLALAVSLTLCCSAYANTPEQIAHQYSRVCTAHHQSKPFHWRIAPLPTSNSHYP
ncbi:hypothetical protein LU293_06445 [Moraxella nasovis]|uniref:hypothetical protein n=1 Tax=Moraxella nasovis TaxID=2904121 RepID=UPI001F615509|nr:hypothetical protein [Moraxella nasovis]UNU72748.1 hypothetical protein LU293_06445 [Moraxella nasovis]